MSNQRNNELKTLQARFGFADHDLKTPSHDEMMVRLDRHILDVCEYLLRVRHPAQWAEGYPEQVIEQAREEWRTRTTHEKGLSEIARGWLQKSPDVKAYDEDHIFTVPEIEFPVSIRKVTWEHPITTGGQSGYGSTYTVGFVDLRVAVEYSPYLATTFPLRDRPCIPAISLGYQKRAVFYFEVKSAIPSLGELVRQIRYYETYLKEDVTFVVTSPDTRWADQLEAQGIRFLAMRKAGEAN